MNNIGIDLVKISRIEKLKNKDKFINKIFTENEIEYIKNKGFKNETLAGMFACKEAVGKALGTGIGKTRWHDIEICHEEDGKPYGKIYVNSSVLYVDLSIAHEKEYAIAVAMIKEKINLRNSQKIKPPLYLTKRKENSHKGNYGRVTIIGGKYGMSGSIYLTSSACLKMGSGLVYAYVPKSIMDILSVKLTEAILKTTKKDKDSLSFENLDSILEIIEKSDVVAIGPGLGWDEDKSLLIKNIIKRANKPLVIDADGLNCISEDVKIFKKKKNKIVITPHIGEMARLTKKSKDYILNNSIEVAKEFSKEFEVVTVLKKHNTVVADPDGNIYINKTGNPGMATAGSGDVLTGIITSLIGQGYNEFDSAKLGVFIHGLAGDIGRYEYGEYSLIASNIVELLPKAIKLCIK